MPAVVSLVTISDAMIGPKSLGAKDRDCGTRHGHVAIEVIQRNQDMHDARLTDFSRISLPKAQPILRWIQMYIWTLYLCLGMEDMMIERYLTTIKTGFLSFTLTGIGELKRWEKFFLHLD